MSEMSIKNEEELEYGILLRLRLREIGKEYGVEINETIIKYAFSELIQKLSRKEKVVVLIDEYDRPILNHMNDGKAEVMRNILREFYVVIKDSDPYLRFAILTGITKLTKTGIFSSLNNLNDVTINKKYSQMMEITQEELKEGFKDHIEETTKELNLNRKELLEKIKEHYNGFSFDGIKSVYNPYSLLKFFDVQEFKNYWIESGTPQYLIEYIKKHKVQTEEIIGEYVTETSLTTYEIENAPPIVYLIQSGYLTFKEKHEYLGYKVDYPNKEIKESMSELLLTGTYEIEENAHVRKI
ncbi:hypothetical protein OSSY52_03800 [Tepiditoga spiralis]|uniref:AAA-ATPase-like domain-containing protein n=1 Tax=Tepiditoga spiralis TaxID=2108365 RepID=A0A7G1GA30_9BACT|nr:AAA family ATPase [Tepiditoga spiralis]BBE30239.1 hypothetical protein OSSY52_03800 [Tepiditoga spiralis]